MKSETKRSSQKCPTKACINPRKNPTSPYQHMFLEDFCRWFSIDLAKDRNEMQFYDVFPETSPLKELFTFQRYNSFEHNMDRLLSHILHTLIFAGKAFVEIVLSTDKDNNVVGISLIPFDPILSLSGLTYTYFTAIQCDRKPKFFKIDNRKIISFSLSDMGFSRYYLKSFYNGLPSFDVLEVSDMSQVAQKTGFDFSVWNDNREYHLLMNSSKIGWYGRNTRNQFMGEAYLLYRTIQFKSLKKRFLDYFIKQINEALNPICKEIKIGGSLFTKSISHDYDDLLQKLHNGEINYSQLREFVFSRTS